MVNYHPHEKVHRLTINFKIPVYIGDVHEGRQQTTRVLTKPPENGYRTENKPNPVRDYSTVIKCSSTGSDSHHKYNPSKGYSLRFSVDLVSSNLWVSSYTPYQQELFDIIQELHEVDGWNFKQISDWLVRNNYQTPRGKTFNQPMCWSIYTKKIKSIQRFSREYDHTITRMSVDVVNYIPSNG